MRIISRRAGAAAATAILLSSLSACALSSSDDGSSSAEGGSLAKNASLDGATLTVGGKEFTEQLILCKITSLALRSAGATVKDKCGLAGSDTTRAALTSGQIDMYWEYTGTAWISYLKKTAPIPGDKQQYEAVKQADAANQIVWLDPAPFNDTYAVAVKTTTAKELGVSSFSDLAALAQKDPSKVTMCVNSEFAARDDGLPGLEKKYGFTVPKGNVSQIAEGTILNTVAKGDPCIFGDGTSTDGRLKSLSLSTLEDDKGFFPVYNPAVNVRSSVLTDNPNIAKVLNPVAAALDNSTIIDLNSKVDIDGQDPGQVAQDWLTSKSFIS
jgi:osmoprotectant transport system substrate-binding protein